MIPCHICGKDASTGWVRGFAPAPDSQKMALCAEHNTQENRLAVAGAWKEMLRERIADLNDVARQKAASVEQMLSVYFKGGGMLSFICTACEATEHGSLKAESPDGALTFIPLSHIREYTLRPLHVSLSGATAAEDENSTAAEDEKLRNGGGQIPEADAATASPRQGAGPLPPGRHADAAESEPPPEHEREAGDEGFFFNKFNKTATSFASALPFSGKKKGPA